MQLTWSDVFERTRGLAPVMQDAGIRNIYGVPRGGIYVALALKAICGFHIVDSVDEADAVVDDIVDSGETRSRYKKRFYALVWKSEEGIAEWVVFPWEAADGERGPEDAVRRLIEYTGDDPNREGLKETPSRVIRSYSEIFGGYKQSPEDVIKTFADGACKEMVVVRDIEFFSCCEHHMLPFVGRAHIAYLPDGKVIGVSKLVRLLEVYSRRLQIQERICQQVTSALDVHLQPLGSACVLEAKHLCMTCRGVNKQNSVMVTSSLTGEFHRPEVRQEFLSLIGR